MFVDNLSAVYEVTPENEKHKHFIIQIHPVVDISWFARSPQRYDNKGTKKAAILHYLLITRDNDIPYSYDDSSDATPIDFHPLSTWY